MLDAKRADNDIVRLAYGYAHISQPAIISGGARGEIGVEKRHDIETAQTTFDARGMRLVPSPLKNLEQNQVADKDRFAASRSFELGGRHSQRATKVGDPDGTVDEDHEERKGRS